MKKALVILAAIVAALTAVACGDESPTGPVTTIEGGFELRFDRGTSRSWSHEVDLGSGSWISAATTLCTELQGPLEKGECATHSVTLGGSVMTFSGVTSAVDEYIDGVRVRWRASGRT